MNSIIITKSSGESGSSVAVKSLHRNEQERVSFFGRFLDNSTDYMKMTICGSSCVFYHFGY